MIKRLNAIFNSLQEFSVMYPYYIVLLWKQTAKLFIFIILFQYLSDDTWAFFNSVKLFKTWSNQIDGCFDLSYVNACLFSSPYITLKMFDDSKVSI